MPNQVRVTKVLVTLLTSMTIGAIILMALGHNPPSAGPFSLWTYYRLDPVQKAISSRAAQSPDRWNRIEIYYSGTKAGNIEQLALLPGAPGAGPEDINFHFCLCNGRGGEDGQIQPTEKWQRQWSLIPGRTWYPRFHGGSSQTIRICVIADGFRDSSPVTRDPSDERRAKTTHRRKASCGLTDCQIKRIETLLDGLCRKFRIQPEAIYYPSDWH